MSTRPDDTTNSVSDSQQTQPTKSSALVAMLRLAAQIGNDNAVHVNAKNELLLMAADHLEASEREEAAIEMWRQRAKAAERWRMLRQYRMSETGELQLVECENCQRVKETSAAIVLETINRVNAPRDIRLVRLVLMIAARAVRRGRHLTDEERLKNFSDAMERDDG